MKTFAVFPTIVVFAFTLMMLLDRPMNGRASLIWSSIVTAIFGGLAAWFASEVFFLLYYLNFVGVLILIPCFTYLTNRLFRRNINPVKKWLRLLGLGLLSTALTLAIFATSMFFALANNPMDPPPNSEQIEEGDRN